MKTFLISANDAGQRLDKFLTKAIPLLPQPLLYKYIRLKRIKCNKKRCEISTRLQEGDLLELYINDEFFSPPTGEAAFLHAPAQIDVLYEDENLLLVNKPSGLIVHEDEKEAFDTLINRILHYLYEKKEYDPKKENSFVPALCNRIDRQYLRYCAGSQKCGSAAGIESAHQGPAGSKAVFMCRARQNAAAQADADSLFKKGCGQKSSAGIRPAHPGTAGRFGRLIRCWRKRRLFLVEN